MKNVLKVSNLSKTYRNYGSEWKRILSWFGFGFKPIEEHTVLHDVSFEIPRGEAIGIVGHNGAGKSTLLKIITGTLRSSSGTVELNGRISAILELGMGFHPDLTGRQNVYHSAGIMGFTRSQIDSVIDDIEKFAEIGDYFDQPVRLYSSGMQVRVAFSIATIYRPDILIVDEALSVGDAYFQHKSFDRIRDLQESGTTLLIVSHDKSAIQAICSRAILLEKGRVVKDGKPEEVMDYYNALIAQRENKTVVQREKDGKVETISGSKEATVEKIELLNSVGERVEVIGVGEAVVLDITVKIHKDIDRLILGYGIKDRLGQVMYGTNTWHTDQPLEDLKAGEIYRYRLSFDANFGVGSYSIQTALHQRESAAGGLNYEWRDLALLFSVINRDKHFFVGTNWNEPTVDIVKS
ncbi:ABC transporter [hydrothermal vent metagenome]|uniref:ABC transporter n=1 Tax=hydrothermal vent metagenome TaxID=652676 RepID=A0A1W1BQE5_9ZZZZ